MTKYRLKNTVVDAVQWFPGVEHPLVRYRDGDEKTPYVVDKEYQVVYLIPGNWIVHFLDGGEIRVVSDVAFKQNYESVSKKRLK